MTKEEFDKEAEEYAIDNYENCLYDDFPYTNDSRAREQSFKDGAEFGYNKAFVEADKNLKAIVTDINKAKEIIKDFMIIVKGAHTTVCGVPEENRTIYVLKLTEEAKQFLINLERYENGK